MALPAMTCAFSSRSNTTSAPSSEPAAETAGRLNMKSRRIGILLALLAGVAQTLFMAPAGAQAAPATTSPGSKVSPVAPRREQVQAIVNEAYNKFKADTRGKNADYIPELAKVDSKLFGIAIVTTDNQSVAVGDTKTPFSIQSIAKVFSLALAMDEQGADKVFEKIGSEPTGRAFNSPVAVVDMPTHSANPLVNAGAIATVRLISGKTPAEKGTKILGFYSRVAGEKLALIDEVYKSEAATNTSNKALSYLL